MKQNTHTHTNGSKQTNSVLRNFRFLNSKQNSFNNWIRGAKYRQVHKLRHKLAVPFHHDVNNVEVQGTRSTSQ